MGGNHKKTEKYFVVNNHKSKKLANDQASQLNYPYYKFMNTKIELPIGESIEVVYHTYNSLFDGRLTTF